MIYVYINDHVYIYINIFTHTHLSRFLPFEKETEVPSQRRTCRFLYSFDF